MTVWIRIALYIFAGWLYGSGYIGDEVKTMLTDDPQVAMALEALVAGIITGVPLLWWRLAKRMGWSL
jgi:membrane associated rhomboid family serine protease